MKPLQQFFHRRSITFALLALVLGSVAAGHGLRVAEAIRLPDGATAFRTIVLCVVAFAACINATINLVRDVDRGYPPGRCSLAAVILLFAFGLSAIPAIALATFMFHD